jgi:CRISPR-associated exonuclease Cas4
MEQSSELVTLGRMLQEISYIRIKKELLIDQKIGIDFIKKGNKLILYEIKRSAKMENAHVAQLFYYIYYLKHLKNIKNIEGRIVYPHQRKIIKVILTKKNEEKIEQVLQQIKQITSLSQPPKPIYNKHCRKCAYFELCFS